MNTALIMSFLAGITIPIGGALASIENIRPLWLEKELRHSVIAFGGGALLAAVSLVLVPEGIKSLDSIVAIVPFICGGICFFLLDKMLNKKKTQMAQFMAMLLDFIPEAIVLGAAFATGQSYGPLLAFIIGLQNFPEGFNAFREHTTTHKGSGKKTLIIFSALSLLGPIATYSGIIFFSKHILLLASLMLFCSGGILYLTFQDIAPQSTLDKHWAPPLGAVLGFSLGILAKVLHS